MSCVCTYVCSHHIHTATSALQASGDGVSDLSAEVVQDDQATPSVVVPEGGGGLMACITPAPHGTLQPICPKCEVCTYVCMNICMYRTYTYVGGWVFVVFLRHEPTISYWELIDNLPICCLLFSPHSLFSPLPIPTCPSPSPLPSPPSLPV